MRRGLLTAVVLVVVGLCPLRPVEAADIVVVDDTAITAFWGYYGAANFADQPEKLWDDTVSWAVGGATPSTVDVLLYTYDGTVSDANAQNIHSIAFYNLLTTAGYSVTVDDRADFAARTDYTGFEMIVFGNLGYSDAGAPDPTNAIGAGLPFITMEPGHSDDLGIGTGVTVFSGTLNYGFVVDNNHVITDDYGLYDTILLDQDHAPGILFDVPTDGIELLIDGTGRVLIGDVPEPATAVLLTIGSLFGVSRFRRRRQR